MSIQNGAKVKGWIKNNTTGALMSFYLNPTEFGHSRSATYAEISAPGSPYPLVQFVKGEAREFPVTLFFHDKPYSGVIPTYESFFAAFLPGENPLANFAKPPEMTFCYGAFVRTCVMIDMDVSYTEMTRDLQPTVGEITLNLRQVGL